MFQAIDASQVQHARRLFSDPAFFERVEAQGRAIAFDPLYHVRLERARLDYDLALPVLTLVAAYHGANASQAGPDAKAAGPASGSSPPVLLTSADTGDAANGSSIPLLDASSDTVTVPREKLIAWLERLDEAACNITDFRNYTEKNCLANKATQAQLAQRTIRSHDALLLAFEVMETLALEVQSARHSGRFDDEG